jgi:hypothetical protein
MKIPIYVKISEIITQIGSGFASFLASLLKMNERDQRIMLLAGAAALQNEPKYMEPIWRQEEDKEERLGGLFSSLTSIDKYLR